jgi:hypothetical protein
MPADLVVSIRYHTPCVQMGSSTAIQIYNLIFRRANKGKNLSIWPIWLVNNELQPEIRFKKENIRLIGIWFGSKKPDMNTFLTPLTQMFIDAWHLGK